MAISDIILMSLVTSIPFLYTFPMMDKTYWNSMLDKVTDLGFYPNLILILMSNISRHEIHEKRRVNIFEIYVRVWYVYAYYV